MVVSWVHGGFVAEGNLLWWFCARRWDVGTNTRGLSG